MSTIPGYHDQPATLDERITIPEDAPKAQGHMVREGLAEQVRDALDEHKEAVKAAVSAPESDASEEDDEEADSVPTGTIDDVLDWVDGDPERAAQALEAERAGSNRSSLIAKLEAI